jgi:hypothetical protein
VEYWCCDLWFWVCVRVEYAGGGSETNPLDHGLIKLEECSVLLRCVNVCSGAYGLSAHFVGTGWRHPSQRVRTLNLYILINVISILLMYRCRQINLINAELNPICHFLALLGAHHILYISRIGVNLCASKRLSSIEVTVDWHVIYLCAIYIQFIFYIYIKWAD